MFTYLIGTGRRDDEDGPDPPATGRTSWYRRLLQWAFLFGNRRVLAFLLSAIILGLLLFVGTVWELEMERLVVETRAVQTLFNTLLGGIILFVSVVVSINTAALSQEFAPLQVKLAQIEDSIQFQVDLEELVGQGVSPAGMQPFLEFVIRAIRTEAVALDEAAADVGTEQAREDLRAFVADIETELALIESRIRDDDARTSLVLLSGLNYPYARHINTARRIRMRHDDDIPETGDDPLEALLEALVVLASGREYFTTLYFKRELRNLSSNLLILSLPVIVYTSYVLLAIDASIFPEASFPGIAPRLVYVLFAFVVALSPYVLLSSYMLRLVTVSKHSLESTVFTLDEKGHLFGR